MSYAIPRGWRDYCQVGVKYALKYHQPFFFTKNQKLFFKLKEESVQRGKNSPSKSNAMDGILFVHLCDIQKTNRKWLRSCKNAERT